MEEKISYKVFFVLENLIEYLKSLIFHFSTQNQVHLSGELQQKIFFYIYESFETLLYFPNA